MTQRTIAMTRSLAVPYTEALRRVRAALQAEGFGVLTEVDVQATLKEKLDVEFRPYTILGACNPSLAHQALQADLDVGVLLPCNVIVYEDDAGSVVRAFDPQIGLALLETPTLGPVGQEARVRIERALASL